MPNTKAINTVKTLFAEYFNEEVIEIKALAPTGSYRQYFRLTSEKHSALGVFNKDLQENKAYISFTKSFQKNKIQVPDIFIVNEEDEAYLVEDLGKKALWDYAKNDMNKEGQLTESTKALYRNSLKELFNIQTKTIQDVDLSYCYPRDAFDKQSMLWDLNYFKYFFLRLMRVAVDEQALEDDIQKLATRLDKENRDNFLFRDFQTRNIMIKEGIPYLIDFQGGRKGAIYYDVASLLYDANVELNQQDINELLSYYYTLHRQQNTTSKEEFNKLFNMFAIVRLTQALGAFGLRGVVEKKPHFKECIPYALKSIENIFKSEDLSTDLPCLAKAIKDAVDSEFISISILS